jgi:hypothetical protein
MKASGIYDFHVHIGETIGGHLLADSWKSSIFFMNITVWKELVFL